MSTAAQLRVCSEWVKAVGPQGNVILADGNYEIMTLLRSHRDDAKGLQIMARHVYPLHSIRLRQSVTAEQLGTALESPGVTTLRGA